MRGTVTLSPDQLAQLVCAVLQSNGYQADVLSLYLEGKLVNYDSAVVACELPGALEVYPPPKAMSPADIDQMLYPKGRMAVKSG